MLRERYVSGFEKEKHADREPAEQLRSEPVPRVGRGEVVDVLERAREGSCAAEEARAVHVAARLWSRSFGSSHSWGQRLAASRASRWRETYDSIEGENPFAEAKRAMQQSSEERGE